jgi:hypothetical protein
MMQIKVKQLKVTIRYIEESGRTKPAATDNSFIKRIMIIIQAMLNPTDKRTVSAKFSLFIAKSFKIKYPGINEK